MQKRKRPMPVGIEDFKKLVQGEYYFVDKTRFLRDLMDLRTDVTLITRPRRFGKTLALSMLQYFFTLEHAEENRKLFEGLDIEKAGTQYMREQGTRPVVFLTLKEVRAGKQAVMMDLLARMLQGLYQCYPYLLTSDRLSEEDKKAFQRVTALDGNEADCRMSLCFLMQCLEKHHGRKPILLL
ncbi:MAG: AAA family ATPase, partial [Selenomonadaceae bacterium]|nr:AAA family ATPase [Selenomonadaceae bacterium]